MHCVSPVTLTLIESRTTCWTTFGAASVDVVIPGGCTPACVHYMPGFFFMRNKPEPVDVLFSSLSGWFFAVGVVCGIAIGMLIAHLA